MIQAVGEPAVLYYCRGSNKLNHEKLCNIINVGNHYNIYHTSFLNKARLEGNPQLALGQT